MIDRNSNVTRPMLALWIKVRALNLALEKLAHIIRGKIKGKRPEH